MANNNYGSLGRNLHMCFSGVKRTSSVHLPYPEGEEEDEEEEEEEEEHRNPPFSSSSVLIKNFNSLYDSNSTNVRRKPSSIQSKGSKHRVTHSVEFYDEDDPISDDSTPDFATVYASQRFFFSSPGRSNSIIDSSSFSSPDSDEATQPECEDNNTPVVKDSVAVPTYSPDPYLDFRRSMQEMVEARKLTNNVADNWEYLHELLFCYLSLNPKSIHTFIIGAFSDLVISLMSPENDAGENGGHRKSCSNPGDGGQK